MHIVQRGTPDCIPSVGKALAFEIGDDLEVMSFSTEIRISVAEATSDRRWFYLGA
jgi:hypothetical protein